MFALVTGQEDWCVCLAFFLVVYLSFPLLSHGSSSACFLVPSVVYFTEGPHLSTTLEGSMYTVV